MASTASFTRQIVGADVVFVVHRARFPLTNVVFAVFMLLLAGSIPVLNVVLLALVVYRIVKMVGDRKPVPIWIRPHELRFEHVSIPLSEVADLSVVGPGGVEVASSSFAFVGVGPGGMAMAAAGAIAHTSGRAFGHGMALLANRARARQLELRVRRRSNSKPIPIVQGLTSETAQALLDDLSEEIRVRVHAGGVWQLAPDPRVMTGHHPGFHVQGHHPAPVQLPASAHDPYQSSMPGPDHRAAAAGSAAPAPSNPSSPFAWSGGTIVATGEAPARDGHTSYVPSVTPTNLRFTNGPLVGQVLPIGPSTIIGREPALAKLVIPDPQVSSAHAWIGFDGTSWVFRDRGSTNGSMVNGVRVRANEDIRLRMGDTVSLGQAHAVSFVVEPARA